MKFIVTVFSAILLRCCWGPSDFQLMLQEDSDITLKELDGKYKINTLSDMDISSLDLSIVFNESTKKVSGFSGCNRFFGSYTSEKNALKFNSLGTTKMLCNEDSNKVEQKFLKALEKANLILFDKNGFSLLKDKKRLLSVTKENLQEQIKIEYTASSRGVYNQIIVNKETVSSLQKRGGEPNRKPSEEKNWKTITEMLKSIDVENISTLNAPSKAFQYDGAAIAHLKITKNGKTYESPPFDHGNPPKEISELVKEILSISENIE
ncbi:META domain-containing protein [Litoribaculum gwangyangense]|uniref:DUF306 domain-containing protein n=1 Tax=Litoribaculum gwangyangense TaxID=1130722 RepID=A0ABP9C332_9FLAO